MHTTINLKKLKHNSAQNNGTFRAFYPSSSINSSRNHNKVFVKTSSLRRTQVQDRARNLISSSQKKKKRFSTVKRSMSNSTNSLTKLRRKQALEKLKIDAAENLVLNSKFRLNRPLRISKMSIKDVKVKPPNHFSIHENLIRTKENEPVIRAFYCEVPTDRSVGEEKDHKESKLKKFDDMFNEVRSFSSERMTSLQDRQTWSVNSKVKQNSNLASLGGRGARNGGKSGQLPHDILSHNKTPRDVSRLNSLIMGSRESKSGSKRGSGYDNLDNLQLLSGGKSSFNRSSFNARRPNRGSLMINRRDPALIKVFEKKLSLQRGSDANSTIEENITSTAEKGDYKAFVYQYQPHLSSINHKSKNQIYRQLQFKEKLDKLTRFEFTVDQLNQKNRMKRRKGPKKFKKSILKKSQISMKKSSSGIYSEMGSVPSELLRPEDLQTGPEIEVKKKSDLTNLKVVTVQNHSRRKVPRVREYLEFSHKPEFATETENSKKKFRRPDSKAEVGITFPSLYLANIKLRANKGMSRDLERERKIDKNFKNLKLTSKKRPEFEGFQKDVEEIKHYIQGILRKNKKSNLGHLLFHQKITKKSKIKGLAQSRIANELEEAAKATLSPPIPQKELKLPISDPDLIYPSQNSLEEVEKYLIKKNELITEPADSIDQESIDIFSKKTNGYFQLKDGHNERNYDIKAFKNSLLVKRYGHFNAKTSGTNHFDFEFSDITEEPSDPEPEEVKLVNFFKMARDHAEEQKQIRKNYVSRLGKKALDYVFYLKRHHLTIDDVIEMPLFSSAHMVEGSQMYFTMVKTGNTYAVREMCKEEKLLPFQIDSVSL